MAITEYASGNKTVSTTEWSLTTNTAGPDVDTTAGAYQAFLEMDALLKADQYAFKVYEKVLASSTQRLVCQWYFANAQSEPVWVSPTLILLNGWDMTLLKLAGTDRSINFSVRRIA
jgi:hypothetical protein